MVLFSIFTAHCLTGCGDEDCPVPTQPESLPLLIVSPTGEGHFPTIQNAVLAAANGDTVWLMSGVYRGGGNRDIEIGMKVVTIRSIINDPTQCIIECRGDSNSAYSGIVVGPGTASKCTIEGVTITGSGYPLEAPNRYDVGAIRCINASSLILRNCSIAGNLAPDAALNGGSARDVEIYDCVFESNGGSVHNYREGSAAKFGSSMTIISNTVFRGNYGSPALSFNGINPEGVIHECRFVENTSGALYAEGIMDVTSCIFRGNDGKYGGAIRYEGEELIVADCTFTANTALHHGGAIYASGSVDHIEGCVFVDNSASERGGAVYHDRNLGTGYLPISSCTFIRGWALDGAAIYDRDGRLDLTNSIVAYSQGGAPLGVRGYYDTYIGCTNIYGNEGGDWDSLQNWQYEAGNYSSDPMFCDLETGDYRLHSESPSAPGGSPCGLVGALDAGCD